MTKVSPYRPAGWAALTSGAIGILAVVFLIGYLVLRGDQSPEAGVLANRLHDAGVILQFLLMIPVVFGLHKLSQQRPPAMSGTTLYTGLGALFFVVLLLLLIFPKVVADVLYMVPQGVFGGWLIFVSWRLTGTLSRGLRWFGLVVGLGLALVGTFPLGYSIFVDTIVLQIPAASAEAFKQMPTSTPAQAMMNSIIHFILFVGSLLGVLLFPLWTILLGRRLLRVETP